MCYWRVFLDTLQKAVPMHLSGAWGLFFVVVLHYDI